jgi:hypothetical protein
MKNLIIIAIILLTGCSTQKKCERIQAKADRLGCHTKDTIVKYTTIRGFRVDTIVKFTERNEVDTLLIDTGGVKVLTIVKWKTRDVFQEILKKDTVIKTVTVYDCPKQKPCEISKMNVFWIDSGKFAWLLLVFAVIIAIFTRYFKK